MEWNRLWHWLRVLSGLWLLLNLFHKTHLFLEIICLWYKDGWILSCVEFASEPLWFGCQLVFGSGLWWNRNVPNIVISLTTALTNSLSPKHLTIIVLKLRNHHLELRLITRQPTYHLPHLIILILQVINIICKLNIFHSSDLTTRARCSNGRLQINLKGFNVSMRFV
jgi:hypothetical protein